MLVENNDVIRANGVNIHPPLTDNYSLILPKKVLKIRTNLVDLFERNYKL